MKSVMVEAAAALAETLERENAALEALDLRGAAALFPAKDAAAAALKAAQTALDGRVADALDAEQRRLTRALAERLRDLTEANRKLLERAINAQNQVVGTIARAVAHSSPRAQPPRYGASGTLAQAKQQPPVMLSARA